MEITVYGDSILKGILLENGRYTINREWEERLNTLLGLRIRNRSRFGGTIRKAMAMIRRDCDIQTGDDSIAVLEFGGNDCDYRWEEVAAAPASEHDCKTPPASFMETYREAVSLIRRAGRRPVLVNLPPIHSERYLGFICRDGLSRDSIMTWLGDVEAISRWQRKYSDMVTKLAEQEGAYLIDLRSAFENAGLSSEELLCADGIHPSRAGQGIIYETLLHTVA